LRTQNEQPVCGELTLKQRRADGISLGSENASGNHADLCEKVGIRHRQVPYSALVLFGPRTRSGRWLLAGGILYTSGIAFFVLGHWYPWHHGIWHLFVIAGSVSHYFSILLLY